MLFSKQHKLTKGTNKFVGPSLFDFFYLNITDWHVISLSARLRLGNQYKNINFNLSIILYCIIS